MSLFAPIDGWLRANELEQIGVDDVGVCRAHAVRKTLVHLQRRVLHELGGELRRVGDRHDLVIVAVHDQRGNVEALEVFARKGAAEEIAFFGGDGLETLRASGGAVEGREGGFIAFGSVDGGG